MRAVAVVVAGLGLVGAGCSNEKGPNPRGNLQCSTDDASFPFPSSCGFNWIKGSMSVQIEGAVPDAGFPPCSGPAAPPEVANSPTCLPPSECKEPCARLGPVRDTESERQALQEADPSCVVFPICAEDFGTLSRFINCWWGCPP